MCSPKRKRKVSGLSLLFFQAVSLSLWLSFFGEDICLRQGWASLETWRPFALSATVAMERSRNGADKSWMRKLMFQRGPHVGGVSGTTLVTNVKLFWCMTRTENGREIRVKKTEREWEGRESQAMGKQLWKWKKYVSAMRDRVVGRTISKNGNHPKRQDC